MGMLQEFKDFALRGNVVDMAVGVVIGAAFGKIVTSFTNDLLMPPIGMLTGGMDFSDLAVTLKEPIGEIAGGRDQLRRVHQRGDRLRDRRVRDLPAREGDEQGDAEGAAAAAAGPDAGKRCCSRRFATRCAADRRADRPMRWQRRGRSEDLEDRRAEGGGAARSRCRWAAAA